MLIPQLWILVASKRLELIVSIAWKIVAIYVGDLPPLIRGSKRYETASVAPRTVKITFATSDLSDKNSPCWGPCSAIIEGPREMAGE